MLTKILKNYRINVPLLTLALLFTASNLFWLHETPLRNLSPLDLAAALKLSSPEKVSITNEPLKFNIAVSPDPSIVHGYVLTDQLSNYVAAFPTERKAQLRNRNRLPTTLAFKVIPRPTSHCHATLELGPEPLHTTSDCATTDDGLVLFNFAQPIPYGILSVKLTFESPIPLDHSIELRKDREGTLWAPALTKSKITSFEALYFWSYEKPSRALGFIFLGISVPLFIATIPSLPVLGALLGLVSAVFISNSLITKPLSGHDETAHIDMLYRSFQSVTGKTTPEATRQFYDNVERMKYESDFFKLHNAGPLPSGTCPHRVIGSCGISERPMVLYRLYAKLASVAKVDWQNPYVLSKLGRNLNLALLIVTMLSIWAICGRTIAASIALILMICTAPLSQAASITNDFPMYLLGIFLVAITASIAHNGAGWRNLLGMASGVLLLGLSHFIDRSWQIGVVMAALGVSITALTFSPKKSEPSPGLRIPTIAFIAILMAGIGFYLMVKTQLNSVLETAHFFSSLAPAKLFELDLLQRLNRNAISIDLEILWTNLKTLIGSYVWGHSFFNGLYYAAASLALILLSISGTKSIAQNLGKTRSMIIYAFIAAALGLYFVLVVSVANNLLIGKAALHAATKARLFAPGIGILLLLPTLGAHRLLEDPVAGKVLKFLACLLAINLLTFWHVQFFLTDTY